MQKLILTGKEARQKIYNGVKIVSDAVCSTLGPMGLNVVISRAFPSQNGMQYYMPFSTKDGVTVARNITISDYVENVGANLIKQAADKTMTDAGDGTTTTCLLTKVILEKGIELLDAGTNPQELKKGIDAAVSHVVSELKKMSVPVNGDIEKIRQVATVSANNDSVIGDLIAEAFSKIGDYGVIDIEESGNSKTEIKISKGIKIDRGWESQYFVTNKAKMECELSDVYILLYDKRISTIAQFGESLESLVRKENQAASSMLIICEDCDGEALAALGMAATNGDLKVCVIKCPEFGDNKRQSMEDLAAITGATYISDEKGRALKTVTLDDLGRAKKVTISKNETSIIEPSGNEEIISDLLNNLKMDLVDKEGEAKEGIEKRIAQLTGSVAVLSVGGATEVEMKEKKDRCDDAVRATKAAISEGIVIGGGSSFLKIHDLVLRCREKDDKFREGATIVWESISFPVIQICKNAGVNDLDMVHEIGSSDKYFGYNALTGKIEDLFLAGIIDPVKVLRCALENAASVSTMILTSNTLIVDTL